MNQDTQDKTRAMVVKANTGDRQSRKRLEDFIRSLCLAKVRTCRSLHACALCGLPIQLGDQYRDKGYGRRAHEICFRAVGKELSE